MLRQSGQVVAGQCLGLRRYTHLSGRVSNHIPWASAHGRMRGWWPCGTCFASPVGKDRRDRLLSFRITCHHSRNTGQQPPPWGRAPAHSPVGPRSPGAFWLPSPTHNLISPHSLALYTCSRRRTHTDTHLASGPETLLSSPSREGPSRPGDLTQAGSSPRCQTSVISYGPLGLEQGRPSHRAPKPQPGLHSGLTEPVATGGKQQSRSEARA